MVKRARKTSIIFFTFLLLCIACNNSNNKVKSNSIDFNWLVGKWINDKDSSATFYENWSKSSFGNYNGTNYVIANNDTVFFESINLIESDTGTFYCVSVKNQNEGAAVNFKLTSNDNQRYSFENKKHDFPQSISYNYHAPDTIIASIEGIVKGKMRKESFLMWRKP
jgi:uncharacterized protein with NRDE domain